MEPGIYVWDRVDSKHAWTKFVINAAGAVVFTDAADGHAVHWSINGSDGPGWVAWVQDALKRGELVKQ